MGLGSSSSTVSCWTETAGLALVLLLLGQTTGKVVEVGERKTLMLLLPLVSFKLLWSISTRSGTGAVGFGAE